MGCAITIRIKINESILNVPAKKASTISCGRPLFSFIFYVLWNLADTPTMLIIVDRLMIKSYSPNIDIYRSRQAAIQSRVAQGNRPPALSKIRT